jgi:hypothetical protein
MTTREVDDDKFGMMTSSGDFAQQAGRYGGADSVGNDLQPQGQQLR